jgi:hypothetical protein
MRRERDAHHAREPETPPMIEPNPNALAHAVAVEVADIVQAVQLVRRAADADDLSTLDRAAALVELASVRCRLDNLLDRLSGAALDLPNGDA